MQREEYFCKIINEVESMTTQDWTQISPPLGLSGHCSQQETSIIPTPKEYLCQV